MVRIVEANSVEERRIANAGNADRVGKFEVGKSYQFVLLSHINPANVDKKDWNVDQDTVRVMQFDHKGVFGFGSPTIKLGDNSFYMTQPLVDPDEVENYVDLETLWGWTPSIGYYLWVAEVTDEDDMANGVVKLWEVQPSAMKQLEQLEKDLSKAGKTLKGVVLNVTKPTKTTFTISPYTHMDSSADDYEIAQPILALNRFANAETMEQQGKFYAAVKDQLIERCDGVTEENFPFDEDGNVIPEFIVS